MKYTLLDGLNWVKKIELLVAPLGWHAALGGSLIYKGGSDKDIDIVLYPHSSEFPAPLDVQTISAKLGCCCKQLKLYKDQKRNVFVLTSLDEGTKLDIFVRP